MTKFPLPHRRYPYRVSVSFTIPLGGLVLYTDVLDSADLGLLGGGLDADRVAASLRRAKVVEIQREADFLAGVSSKTEWASEAVPAALLAPGTYWLEWRIPKGANCGGAPLGALVTVEGTEAAGMRLSVLCFMQRTYMLRFDIEFDAKGSAIPADRLLTDVVHDGRQHLPLAERPFERDDLYNETFSFVFVVPVLFHFLASAHGGLEQARSALQQVGKPWRTLPEALAALAPVLRPIPEANRPVRHSAPPPPKVQRAALHGAASAS